MTGCGFPSYINLFQKHVFSECWNKHFRGSRNQNFLHCLTMVGRPLKKSSLLILQFSGGLSVSFLKIKRVKISKFLLLPLSGILKISERKYETLNKTKYLKSVCKLDKLFKPIVTNALSFHRLWRIRSTCVTKVGCPFWICWTLPLNSKIGSDAINCEVLKTKSNQKIKLLKLKKKQKKRKKQKMIYLKYISNPSTRLSKGH